MLSLRRYVYLKHRDSSIASGRLPATYHRVAAGVPARSPLLAAGVVLLSASALAAASGYAGAMVGVDAVPPQVRRLAPVLIPGPERGARYVLVLEGEPVTWVSPPADVSALRARQNEVADHVGAAGGTVVSRYETILNGLLVDLPPEVHDRVRRLGLVRAIYRAPSLQPTLGRSVPFIGADRVVRDLGLDGTGATIAIVDTGIDYTHAAFGGSGDPAAYAANLPGIVEPDSFPTSKVVGGWDFAGSGFDPGCSIADEVAGRCNRTPKPDPDPLDEQGHGTHVASVAAGFAEGEVSAGVAPGAQLVALKIFGEEGGTDLLLDALEWVVRARTGLPVPGRAVRVDVVNLSLGSPYGVGLFEDEGIVRRLTESGVIVVAAAGNEGDKPYIVASPAAADWALAVGASYDDGEESLAVEVVWSAQGGGHVQTQGTEPDFTRPFTRVGAISAPLAWMGSGCQGVPVVQGVRGHVALIDRADCSPFEKIDRARDLGAVAAVVYTDDRPVETLTGSRTTDLAAVLIPSGDGLRLRALLEAGVDATIAIDPGRTIRHPDMADRLWPHSSRGPVARGFRPVPKPDLTAPGTSISAAAMGTGLEGRSEFGTSMAAPHVSGVAALLRASHPNLAAAEVARTITSATHPVGDSRAGAGRLDAVAAVSNGAFLVSDHLSGVDFGRLGEAGSFTRTVQLANVSPNAKRYRLALDAPARLGAGFKLATREVEVAPGSRAAFDLAVEVKPAFGAGPSAVRGGGLVASGEALSELEFRARLFATEVDAGDVPVPEGSRLQMPVAARLEPASQAFVVRASTVVTGAGASGPATFSVKNDGPAPAPVEAYLWFGDDGADEHVDPRIDIRHVGARILRGPEGVDVVEFAVTLAEPSPSPVGLALTVYIDSDSDGDLDWLIVGTDAEVLFEGGYSGEWLTVTVPFPDGAVVPDWSRAAIGEAGDVRLDGAYVVVRVAADSLGLASSGEAGSSNPLEFFVATEDRLWSGRYLDVVDVAPGSAGLTAPDRLWSWDPVARDLVARPWTSLIEPQGVQTVRLAAARGADDARVPPPPGLLLLYPLNAQAPAVRPYMAGEAYSVTVPRRLPSTLSPAYLPALPGESARP